MHIGRDVARIQNRWEFWNYRRAQYVSKMQSESKSRYLYTAYSIIFQPENLSSSIFSSSRLLSTSLIGLLVNPTADQRQTSPFNL